MRNQTAGVIRKNLQEVAINSKVEVFSQSPCFVHLGQDKLYELARLANFCYYKKGELIFQEGDMSGFFYIIQKGKVKLFKQSTCGKNFTVGMLHEGDTVHCAVVFDGKPRWASAQARSDLILLRIRREEFLSFVAKNPSIAMSFISLLGEQIERAYDRLRDMAVHRVDQRLISILYMISSKSGDTLFLTAEEIADLAGTTRETASRVMVRLKNSGIIHYTRGRITVLDQTKLRTQDI